MADDDPRLMGPLVEVETTPGSRPPRAVPGSRFQVLFLRRKPRMFRATYGPIRHDPGTITFHRDYLELSGSGVRHEGWSAARIVIPCVLFGGPVGALVAYFWIEYVLARPMRVMVPLVQIRRVVLDPLRGTVMIGAASYPGGETLRWHSFATASAWAIFDGLEPLLEPGTCGLVTRRDRALKRGDLAAFLAVLSLTPLAGLLCALLGLAAGVSAAMLGQRRYGLAAAAASLFLALAQTAYFTWYFRLWPWT